MKLTPCLKKAGAALRAEDKADILAAAAAYRKQGMNAKQAAMQAIKDQLDGVSSRLRATMARGGQDDPTALPVPAGQGVPGGANAGRVGSAAAAFVRRAAIDRAAGREEFNPAFEPAEPEVADAFEPVAQAVAQALGTNPVALVRSKELDRDGVHWVGQNLVNVEGLTLPAVFVAIHESVHELQSVARAARRKGDSASPMERRTLEIWDRMERAIWSMVPAAERVRFAKDALGKGLDDKTRNEVRDEFLADFTAKRMTDPKTLVELARREPTHFEAFAKLIIQTLDKVLAALRGTESELGARDADRYIKDIERARQIWADAVAEFAAASRSDRGATPAPVERVGGAETRDPAQAFVVRSALYDGFGASIGSILEGNRRQLMVDPAGGYFWGDWRQEAKRDVGAVAGGADKDATPASFATGKEARAAAAATPPTKIAPAAEQDAPRASGRSASPARQAKIDEAVAAAIEGGVPEYAVQDAAELVAKYPGAPEADVSDSDRARLEAAIAPLIDRAKALQPGFKAQVELLAERLKAKPKVPGVKGLKRAAEKMSDTEKETGDPFDPAWLKDLVRGSIVVGAMEEVPAAIEAVREVFTVTRVKDRFVNPTNAGYRDVLMSVDLGGMTAELQIHIPEMLAAKELGHLLYEVERVAPDGEEKTRLQEAQARFYGAAFDAATGAEPRLSQRSTKAKNSSREIDSSSSSERRTTPVAADLGDSPGSRTTGNSSLAKNLVPSGSDVKSITETSDSDPSSDAPIVNLAPQPQFDLRVLKEGSLRVLGDQEAIRALLPSDVKGRKIPGGMLFTPSDAPRARAALEGRKLAYSRAGQVIDKLPMKDGKYVGAPEKFNTPQKIPQLRKILRQLAEEGAPGRFWYENSSKEVLQMVGGDVNEARKFVALLAIYSPQAKVDTNSTFALRAWSQYKAGQPISVKTKVMDDKATAALNDIDAFWSGEKTGNFFNNLLREIDPSVADKQGATIDMWMMRAAQYESDAPTATQYAFMENENNRIARDLGWEPQQVQAAIWVAMKARTENKGVKQRTEAISEKRKWIRFDEANGKKVRVILDAQKHRDNWLKQAMEHDVTKGDTQAAKFDFSDGLRRHIGQISWEARPGRSTGVLPGVNDAPYAQQVEFQQAVQKALYSEEGADLLAQQLGLLVDGPDILAPGVWQGEIAAGMQKQVAMAPGKGEDGKSIDTSQKQALDLYAATLGLLLRQEGVGWHRPFYKGKRSEENGVELRVGRPLTPDEAKSLWAAVDERMRAAGVADWEQGAGMISSPVGMRLVNFGAVDNNAKFRELIQDAATVLAVDEVDPVFFSSDGNLVTNDWKEAPNGQGFARSIREAGRSDLLGWAAIVLAPRVQAVFDDFSKRYGWGDPGRVEDLFEDDAVRFSGRSDAARSGRDREVAVGELRAGQAYGVATEGAASPVEAYHFSQAQRASLNTAFYGSGLRGAEAERLALSSDRRIKSRAYFYFDQGTGIKPESGVGGHAHRVTLNNLYDPADGRLRRPGMTANEFESAVLDAGYDGYMTRLPGTQSGQAVLLGAHNVPVEYLGLGAPGKTQPAPASQAAAALSRKVGGDLVTLKDFDVAAVRALAQIQAAAPSFRLEWGKARVKAEEAEAAVEALEEAGSSVRFSRRADGEPQPAAGGAAFSGRIGKSLAERLNDAKAIELPTGYLVGDYLKSSGKISWWHKTVGTMHDLAAREPLFRPVYNLAQRFIADISTWATKAADLAPNLLPKLERLRDITKSPLSADDTKALAAPVFQGTLSWTRDWSGAPIKMETAEGKASRLSVEEKARVMIRNGALSPQVYKMWMGMKVDQHDAMVNARYAKMALKPGVVWSDAELRTMFNLNDRQIGLYREFRRATDESLRSLSVSDMVRFGGKDLAAVADEAMAAPTVEEARDILVRHLDAQIVAEPERADVLTDTAAKVIAKADQARDLMKRGYAPLQRFGRYTVDVLSADGERLYFSMFETEREANKRAREMQQEFPAATVKQGTMSQQQFQVFAGISPETAELFGEMMGLEANGMGQGDKAFQQWLKLAKSNRSAMKRLIERKGIAGFSEDVGRVLATFVYSNARQTSKNLNFGPMSQAVMAISEEKGEGEILDAAVGLQQYVSNPQEEAAALRGLLFTQFLGGSIAAGLVNMVQPIQVTFPYLTQWGGVAKAASRMRKALARTVAWETGTKTTGNKDLDKAIKEAEDDGTISPQEVHQLIAQAGGAGSLRTGDGTRAGDLQAKASNLLSKVMLVWGKPFAAAEQFNRRATFIAAWETATQEGLDNPAEFARKAIQDTQFVYNKGNRPQWARGAVGATLFTFKIYSISFVELAARLAKSGPEGKRSALVMLAMLVLIGGLQGIPGADDLDDVIDGLMQRLGYNWSTADRKQEIVKAAFGDALGEFVLNGLSGLPGAPIDVSNRLGLGNLIPGTGLLTKKEDYGRDVMEILGPAGSLASQVMTAAGKVVEGEFAQAGKALAPVAAANLIKGLDMASMGMYRDKDGRKVIDTDGMDAIAKAIGFQPRDVAKVQEAATVQNRLIATNKMRESEIADKWAQGIFESDADKVRDAKDELKRWNESNPTMRIEIDNAQIVRRLRQMRMTRAERLAKTAPAQIRRQVQEELAR